MRVLRVIKRALARSLEDDLFGIAKAGAYSSILTMFPALMVVIRRITPKGSALVARPADYGA